ncbi:MAG: hypothetical protein QOC87_2152, partial [Actinomycetota bacterium]|nr:hypothetical protein [Actinomycetota bacterium]
LQAIARADYGFFLRHEVASRRELGYPPFSELISIRGPAIDSEALAAAAAVCKSTGAQVVGPAPRAGRDGATLVAKCPNAQRTAAALRDLASSADGRTLSFDVDPR